MNRILAGVVEFILVVGTGIPFLLFVLPPIDATFGGWLVIAPIVAIAVIAKYGWPQNPWVSRPLFYVLLAVVSYLFWRHVAPVLQDTFGDWWMPSLVVALFIVVVTRDWLRKRREKEQ
jgi:predicted membrane channel-forming protein YqfA (hemolysin III family)